MERINRNSMSQTDRLELAAKLDKELDEFIDSLPRKKYEDGWPEDRWEEEMEKHPFFMTKPPEPGAELHPLYEGLQKLKYDPEENEPEELAISYKEDGNFNFQYKNYRLAILSYTEGLKTKCGNKEIEAMLYNNRSAAHFFLENYRSSLMDCENVLKIEPNHLKALIRAANCCFKCEKYEKAVEFCEKILENNKMQKISELKLNCVKQLKIKERDERKKQLELLKETTNLMQTIQEAGVNLKTDDIEPRFPQLYGHWVHLDENSYLVWPVVFLYPEYHIIEFIQEFQEHVRFSEILNEMLEQTPIWDDEKKYNPTSVDIYYRTVQNKLKTVDPNETLASILKEEDYIVENGTPSFTLLVRDSPAEQAFLARY